jgi:hypothetical protein
MGEQATFRTMREEISRYPAQHPFANASMAVCSGYDEISPVLFSHKDQLIRRRRLSLGADLTLGLYLVAFEMPHHI